MNENLTNHLNRIREEAKNLIRDIQLLDNNVQPLSFIESMNTLTELPGKVVFVLSLFKELDEHLSKRGDLPKPWGPRGACSNCGTSCGCAHNFTE